jgi:hypothetical protein
MQRVIAIKNIIKIYRQRYNISLLGDVEKKLFVEGGKSIFIPNYI